MGPVTPDADHRMDAHVTATRSRARVGTPANLG
jgi:hypothetical protein